MAQNGCLLHARNLSKLEMTLRTVYRHEIFATTSGLDYFSPVLHLFWSQIFSPQRLNMDWLTLVTADFQNFCFLQLNLSRWNKTFFVIKRKWKKGAVSFAALCYMYLFCFFSVACWFLLCPQFWSFKFQGQISEWVSYLEFFQLMNITESIFFKQKRMHSVFM